MPEAYALSWAESLWRRRRSPTRVLISICPRWMIFATGHRRQRADRGWRCSAGENLDAVVLGVAPIRTTRTDEALGVHSSPQTGPSPLSTVAAKRLGVRTVDVPTRAAFRRPPSVEPPSASEAAREAPGRLRACRLANAFRGSFRARAPIMLFQQTNVAGPPRMRARQLRRPAAPQGRGTARRHDLRAERRPQSRRLMLARCPRGATAERNQQRPGRPGDAARTTPGDR